MKLKEKLKFYLPFIILVFTFCPLRLAFSFSLEGRVKEFTLQNGIKVLLLERRQAPTIALYIRFRVGAVDENLGMTGTAHLLEHLLFKGTKTLGTKNYAAEEKILNRIDSIGMALDAEKAKGEKANQEFIKYLQKTLQELTEEHRKLIIKDEIELIYSQNGAVGFNAMTSVDTTTYVVNLPANRLELWARIESDRILNPVLREFYSERDVVMEERRRSYDSQPQRKLMEHFLATAFLAHPYGRPIIGWASDIQFLDKQRTEQFFRTYYSPENMVITIVGDLSPELTISLLKKYFARIPRKVLPPPLPTREPEQLGERRLKIMADAQPELIIGFHKPNPPHPDDVVCEVISGLLSYGRTSRFYQKLVEERKIAVDISTSSSFPGVRYPNLFVIFATPRHPHTTEELEKAIYKELEELATTPVSERELKKIQNQIQADYLRQLSSNSKLAYWLSYYQCLFGDWRFLTQRLKDYEKVTPEDVIRVARQYFQERNRTVGVLIKSGAKKEER